MMLETERVRFHIPQQALQLGRVTWVPDPRERLPCKIPGAIHIRAPGFPSFIEALVRRVRAEDEQEGEHGRRERERQGGHLESREPVGEVVLHHVVVKNGDEDGE